MHTAALVLIGAGAALIACHYLCRHLKHRVAWPFTFAWRMRRTMIHLGLTGKDGDAPRLRGRRRQGQVWTLSWKMPVGVTSERVQARQQALEEALDCQLNIWWADRLLHMRAGRARVPEIHGFRHSVGEGALPIHLGASREGPLDVDLSRFPHLLIGGTSGGGKSSAVQSIVLQLVQRLSPAQLQVVLIDLKGGLDMAVFDRLPHLRWPVAGRHEDAAVALGEVVEEQEHRQDQMRGRATNLAEWNAQVPAEERLPHIVVVIDEEADLLPKEAATREEREAREQAWAAVSALTRMGRASGIHVIIATQRPDAEVLPGQIRANCPAKIALHCATDINSYILLGQGNAAAARLPTRPDGTPLPGRAIFQWGREVLFQAAWLPTAEIERAVQVIRERYAPRPALPAHPTPAALTPRMQIGGSDSEEVTRR